MRSLLLSELAMPREGLAAPKSTAQQQVHKSGKIRRIKIQPAIEEKSKSLTVLVISIFYKQTQKLG